MDNNSSPKFVYEESNIVTPDYCGRRGQKTTISDISVKKRVLLVCVYNKKGTLITHDVIYRLFMEYGEIYKILIFHKCKNWKIFVEMATLEQAERARDGLNNSQLFEDGSKMTVYYAKVDQIVFQNNNSGGVDYRELKQRKVNQINNFQSSGMINQAQNFLNGSQKNSPLHGTGDNHNSTEKHRNHSVDYSELYRTFESVPNTRVSPHHSRQIGDQKNSIFQNIQPVQIAFNGKNSEESLNDQSNQQSNNNISNSEFEEADNLNNLQQDNQRVDSNHSQEHLDVGSANRIDSSPQSEKEVEKQLGNFNFKSSHEYKSGSNTAVVSSNNFNSECGSYHNNIQNQPNSNYSNNNNEIGSFSSTNNNPESSKLGLFKMGFKLEDDDFVGQGEGLKAKKELSDQDKSKYPGDNGNRIAQNEIDPSSYVNPLYIIENKKSRVIYVRGLEKKNLTTKKIYNLFSNFGNIELILYFTDKKYCLIQYESQEDATIAKENLDSLKVESNQMRIFYSNYESIKENQEGEKQCEVWKGDKSSFRFRYNKQISINPVTSTLHVSNLRQDTCKQEVIDQKFSPFGTIEAFQPLNHQNKFMCHVKFSSIEEAINALCNLHDEEIAGRKIHISFTRTRISPQQTPDNYIGAQQQTSNYKKSSHHTNTNNYNGNQNINSSPQIHQQNGNQINNYQNNFNNNDPINDVTQALRILNDDEEIKSNVQPMQYSLYQNPYYIHPQLFQQPIGYIQNMPATYQPNNQIPSNQPNSIGYFTQYPQQIRTGVNMQPQNYYYQ